MSNMSYCRFQNTLIDLEDCVEHMGDPLPEDDPDNKNDDTLSEEEADARYRLIQLCIAVARDYGSQ